MLRYVKLLIRLRRRHRSLSRNSFLTGTPIPGRGVPDVSWHGARLNDPGWDDPTGRMLAYTLAGWDEGEDDLHVILNMCDATCEAELPSIPDRTWYLAVDTSHPEPEDIVEPLSQQRYDRPMYEVGPRSMVVLEARNTRPG